MSRKACGLILVMTGLILTLVAATFSKCAPPRSVKSEYNQATCVFIGEVISEEEKQLPRPNGVTDIAEVYRFKVKKYWKGEGKEYLEIYVLKMKVSDRRYVFAPEQVRFKRGERYLVYGYKEGANLLAYGCTRTREVQYAKEDLHFLGQGRQSR